MNYALAKAKLRSRETRRRTLKCPSGGCALLMHNVGISVRKSNCRRKMHSACVANATRRKTPCFEKSGGGEDSRRQCRIL